MTIDPHTTDAIDVYKLLIGTIVPRPIAFVSTVSTEGVRNLAPFSFFTAVSASPPVVCFSPMITPDGERKDTLENVTQTGQFVVNVVSEEFAERMVRTSADLPASVDEFEYAGFTPVPGVAVDVPRVGESRLSMECRVVEIVEVSARPFGGSLVLGEVLRFHCEDALVDGMRIDPDGLDAIGRMGGNMYTRTRDRFELARPSAPGSRRGR